MNPHEQLGEGIKLFSACLSNARPRIKYKGFFIILFKKYNFKLFTDDIPLIVSGKEFQISIDNDKKSLKERDILNGPAGNDWRVLERHQPLTTNDE